ncbi:MAG: terpene cyclase/mutase family protein [Planctomycetes bacterium]|nr:terpene cyclase/mutase family protein [Planctomycetota bacterium]
MSARAAALAAALWGTAALCGAPASAQDVAPDAPPASEEGRDLSPAQARAALDRALGYLVAEQREDGSWGAGVPSDLRELGFAWDTFYAWNQAANAIVLMALLDAPETPERRAALERGLEWLCSARPAHRGDTWDVDSTWASLYGFTCLVTVAQDPRFADEAWQAKLRERGLRYYADLVRRQTLLGGWAYYDDPPITAKPTWATSFCTALVIPALLEARDALGWPVDAVVAERAVRAVQRCKRPNGAYTYNVELRPSGHGGVSIDQVPGSLGRIQVCNWALSTAGDAKVTADAIREGLEEFFTFHHFMDSTRMKPIPHEGPFANAGYFYFFGHYYAARAIGRLPLEERELWHRRLRYHVTNTQTASGKSSDFLTSDYVENACTAFAALVLSRGLADAEAAAAAAEVGR